MGGQVRSNSAFGHCLSVVLHHLRRLSIANLILSPYQYQPMMAGSPASSFVHTLWILV
jgi:hypothetical protein